MFTGTVTANCGILSCSDLRYKKEIEPVTNILHKVLSVQAIYYYWDSNNYPAHGFNDERQVGFAAQEIEKIFPEMVHTDAEGYKSIDYSRLTPYLLEAIKEQQKMIDNLQQQINRNQN